MNSTYKTIIALIKTLKINEQVALIKELEKIQIINLISTNSIFTLTHNLYGLYGDQKCCPYCQSKIVIKYGKYQNRQRYLCKECERTFNNHTNTALHYLHCLSDVPLYLQEMSETKSLRNIAKTLNCSLAKSFAWRHKFLKALGGINTSILKGIIQADDTYILISYKGLKDIFSKVGRKRRKRKGKSSKRGISDDLATFLAATDSGGDYVLKLVGRGRLTKGDVHKTLNSPIRKNKKNKDILVTDSHNAYPSFAKRKNLLHKEICVSKGIYITDDGYHLGHVNSLHQRFKRFLKKFIGIATGYAPHYIAYFKAWEQLKKQENNLNELGKMVLSTVNVFLRYKDMRQLKMVDFL